MNIKYEKNSRVNKALTAGRITPDDVIKKCATHEFPAETATVRLHRIQSQNPWAVIHIKGRGSRGHTICGTVEHILMSMLRP